VFQRLSSSLDRFFAWLAQVYGASLEVVLKRRRAAAALIAGVVAVFALSAFVFTKMQMQMIPHSDGGKMQVEVELPQGADLNMSALVLREIENRLAKYPEVRTITTNLGKSVDGLHDDVNRAYMQIKLSDKSGRAKESSEIAAEMTRTLSTIPGADIMVTALSESSSGTNSDISMQVAGTDTDTLMGLAEKMKAVIEKVPGVMTVSLNSEGGKRELEFTPDRKQIAQDGLTVQQVALALRYAIDGVVASEYRDEGNEYDIRVKMNPEDLTTIEDIRNIPVAAKNGVYTLSRYADLHWDTGYSMIMRVDKERSVQVNINLLPGYATTGVQAAIDAAFAEQVQFPEGYGIKAAGLSKEMNTTINGLIKVILIAIILTYMLIAVILESYKQPLFILSTVPLALIGIVGALFLTRTTMNMIAMIGIVMLIGIVVNNAILILDYYNQLRRDEGLGIREALLKACPAKLKAILMSNIAIILGEMPMALGIGASGAEMRAPMGIVIIGGVVSSTLLTLWLIPCLELVFTRRKK
jgi:HAE1 family hydrophobic/amphiphilic exporter-1